MTQAQPVSIFHWPLVRPALKDSLVKLSPAVMASNPVMFVVEVGSVLTTVIWLRDLVAHPAGAAPARAVRPPLRSAVICAQAGRGMLLSSDRSRMP